MIKVVNKRQCDDGFPIGRPGPLGNPFSHLKPTPKNCIAADNRHDACLKYREWLRYKLLAKDSAIVKYLKTIYNAATRQHVNLVCSCAPLECHGDYIKEIVEKKWFKFDNDGKNHINIYSKGRTELGRLLSNFAHTPFTVDGSEFASLEGYWYWLSTGRQFSKLKSLHGFAAKQHGQTLPKVEISAVDFNKAVKSAIKEKYNQTPQIQELLRGTNLLLTHYYSDGINVVRLPQYDWQVEAWEKLRE